MGKVVKWCFVGFGLRALETLGTMEGRCNKAELHTLLQIHSVVRLLLHAAQKTAAVSLRYHMSGKHAI